MAAPDHYLAVPTHPPVTFDFLVGDGSAKGLLCSPTVVIQFSC